MKSKNIVNKLLILVVLSIVSLSYAAPPAPPGGGGGTSGPGELMDTPIDMYEGVLMIVATSMIAGYYFVRNRRQTN